MINNLRYANDTTLITGNLDDLRILINTVKETSKKAGLRLNIKKTKVMATAGLQEFKLEDDHIKIVHNFNFNFWGRLFVTMLIAKKKFQEGLPWVAVT